jgi:hypothetical protein
MNELSIVSDFTIDKFKSNPLVNTIAFEKTVEMDYNKENLYPLVNIDIINSVVTDQEIGVNYIITIVEARDIDNELNNDKIYGTNMIDNLNECHTIAVKFINEIRKQNNDYSIEMTNLSSITFLKLYEGVLDGVRFTMTLNIENGVTSC